MVSLAGSVPLAGSTLTTFPSCAPGLGSSAKDGPTQATNATTASRAKVRRSMLRTPWVQGEDTSRDLRQSRPAQPLQLTCHPATQSFEPLNICMNQSTHAGRGGSLRGQRSHRLTGEFVALLLELGRVG